MTESRETTIEINDCEFLAFQGLFYSFHFLTSIIIEFLRFLYCEEVKFDADLAIKLIAFADKHTQDDLVDACMHFLKFNINSDNVYAILEFASQEDIPILKSLGAKFFQEKLNFEVLLELIQHLDIPEFVQANPEVRSIATRFILKNYLKIFLEQKTNLEFYENILIRNVAMDTIVSLISFIYKESDRGQPSLHPFKPNPYRDQKEMMSQGTANLKIAIFNFVQKNFEKLEQEKLVSKFSKDFFIDLCSFTFKTCINLQDTRN